MYENLCSYMALQKTLSVLSEVIQDRCVRCHVEDRLNINNTIIYKHILTEFAYNFELLYLPVAV